MPSARRSTTAVGIELDVVEGRYAELDEYTVGVETFSQDLDTARYSAGYPMTAARADTSVT